jgi:hypothetical protein
VERWKLQKVKVRYILLSIVLAKQYRRLKEVKIDKSGFPEIQDDTSLK